MVVMVNAGETVAPEATVTEAGTDAAGLLLVSVTTAPCPGAGPLSVTVLAVLESPPAREAGDKLTVAAASGPTFNVPFAVVPP